MAFLHRLIYRIDVDKPYRLPVDMNTKLLKALTSLEIPRVGVRALSGQLNKIVNKITMITGNNET